MKTWHWILGGVAAAGAGYLGWRYLYGKREPNYSPGPGKEPDPAPKYEVGFQFAPECQCSITDRSLKGKTWWYEWSCKDENVLHFIKTVAGGYWSAGYTSDIESAIQNKTTECARGIQQERAFIDSEEVPESEMFGRAPSGIRVI